MSCISVRVVSGVALATLLLAVEPVRAQSSLGDAEDFAVLAGSTVTNTGPSVADGDLGVSPGSSITGFPPGTITGTEHSADAIADDAKDDLVDQYNDLENATCNTDLTGQNLGGLTLTPGVYCFSSSAGLTGTLTLNAQGDSDATFIFQVGSALTTASGSDVNVTNGGNPCGVGWQIGSSATLGTNSDFTGNLIALSSITMNTGADLVGRALARNGAVTMESNDVSFDDCAVAGGPPDLPGPGPDPVPTLATWAMIALIGLLGLAGFATLRRRQSLS